MLNDLLMRVGQRKEINSQMLYYYIIMILCNNKLHLVVGVSMQLMSLNVAVAGGLKLQMFPLAIHIANLLIHFVMGNNELRTTFVGFFFQK